MNVWMVGTEMAPFSKVGGLGDVLGALPQAMAGLGCDVTVVLPHLPTMDVKRWGIGSTGVVVRVFLDGVWREAQVLEARAAGGVRVLFILYPPYFHRPNLYGTPSGDYPDNAQRFAFFSYATIEAMKGTGDHPDVIHTHDWQTGLVPFLLATPEHYGADPWFAGKITVHTIHNLSYQGLFPAVVLPTLGISWAHFHFKGVEFYGLLNFLKAGLVFADALTTVSPTYAKEIQTFDYAWGLQGVLVERANDLHGILNGIDTDIWDPKTDPLIPARFQVGDVAPREENRRMLRRKLKLPNTGDHVVGLVNRLVARKESTSS